MTNKKLLIENEVAGRLQEYAARISNYSVMSSFQNKYKAIVKEYDNSNYAILSTGIFIDKLDSFEVWLPELLANKNKIVPILISNMLYGDMFAESVYRGIYNKIGRSDLVLDIYQILNDAELESRFIANGGDGPAEAKVNAEHWLASPEAAEIFTANDQGNQTLCLANELLGINNNFVEY